MLCVNAWHILVFFLINTVKIYLLFLGFGWSFKDYT